MANAKSKFTAYLVMPKVMMHREDGLYQELPKICWTPFGPLWKSREEAEAFARQHIEKIQGATYLSVFTTKLVDSQFDFEKLPHATQQELRKLLEITKNEDWRTAIDNFRLFPWDLEKKPAAKRLRRLLELLEIVPYRIVEAQVTQKQFDSLSEAIAHYNGFEGMQSDDEDQEDEEHEDEEQEDEDIFEDEDESAITKYLRPVGLAFGLERCPEDSIHPEQEFVDGNEGQAGDSGVFW